VRCESGRARWCAMRCAQTTTTSKRHCSIVVWPCSRRSDSVATRSARSLADSGLVGSIPTPIPTLIPIPTPIAVPNESAGDTQAKNLFSLFLHHHLGDCRRETQSAWRRMLVRLSEAASRPWSLYGRLAATSMPDEKTSQVVGFSTEIALHLGSRGLAKMLLYRLGLSAACDRRVERR
jgi:hypothetical protein